MKSSPAALRVAVRNPEPARPTRRRRRARLETDRPPTGKRLLRRYEALCQRLIGHRWDHTSEPQATLRLKQAGLGYTPGLYRALLVVTSLLAALGTGLIVGLVAGLATPFAYPAALAVAVATLTGLATVAAFPFTVRNRIQNRQARLDREIPFALSELSVLASIGLSPIELMRRMARNDRPGALTAEFRKVTYKTDVQGADLITALAETARESPSDLVRQTFWDLANMIHQGGDLDAYLRNQSDEVLQAKRASQKEFIARLGTYAEIYITLVLIGVMFLGVGAFLLDSFGMTAGGLTADALLLLLTYGVVPLIVIALGILLSTAHQAAE